MTVKPIPDGRHSITPYLVVEGVPRLIEFLVEAFEAQEILRVLRPDGSIMTAQLKIGDSVILLSEAKGEFKPMPAAIYLYVNDTDAVYQRALQAGATSLMEPIDEFYGDRNAGVKDPGGNHWWIATHQEDVPPGELSKRIH